MKSACLGNKNQFTFQSGFFKPKNDSIPQKGYVKLKLYFENKFLDLKINKFYLFNKCAENLQKKIMN